jgi:hypothetical protein
MPSAGDRLTPLGGPPGQPGRVPVPESLRQLSALFLRVRAEFDKKGKEAGQRPVTNRQIAELAYQSSGRHFIPGRPRSPLARRPSDAHMSGVLKDRTSVESVADVKELVIPGPALAFHIAKGLSSSQREALLAYELAERSRAELDKRSGAGVADPAPQPPAASHLYAVVDAILAQLVPASRPGPRGKLPAAVELALCRAIDEFGMRDGKPSLTWPLLDPDGFLADPDIAAILTRALTGGYLEGAPVLGRAWARAFLDGTRADALTAEAENLLGYLWEQAQKLRLLTDLAESRQAQAPATAAAPPASAPRVAPREPPAHITEKELRRQLSVARGLVADFDRVAACDFGRSGRNLPPELRFFLNDQTRLVAAASRDFVGRESVLAEVRAFTEGDEDGYCFILAKLGVGKTALLAHLVAGQPGYARHFNVLSEGVRTAEQFLNNVCAQLIGAYRLDPGLFPKSGDASTDLLTRLLENSATKARGEKVIVMIDALDEAMTGTRLPGVNPLTLPRSLPEGCRFIVTVRDGTEGWEPALDAGCAVRKLGIDVSGGENMDDARRYVRSRLASPGIVSYLRQENLAGGEFTDEVAARSEGYFVYLRHVLDQYDAGGDLAGRDLAELPVGLRPYYDDQYERMRADTPPRQWEKIRLPVLIQLAIAEQPLTLYELAAGAGQREAAPVMSAIEQWRQFLVETDASWNGGRVPGYRLFHESFREFLKKKHEHAAEVAEVEQALRENWGRRARARYGRGGPRPL